VYDKKFVALIKNLPYKLSVKLLSISIDLTFRCWSYERYKFLPSQQENINTVFKNISDYAISNKSDLSILAQGLQIIDSEYAELANRSAITRHILYALQQAIKLIMNQKINKMFFDSINSAANAYAVAEHKKADTGGNVYPGILRFYTLWWNRCKPFVMEELLNIVKLAVGEKYLIN